MLRCHNCGCWYDSRQTASGLFCANCKEKRDRARERKALLHTQYMIEDARAGDEAAVEWLERRGVTWSDADADEPDKPASDDAWWTD